MRVFTDMFGQGRVKDRGMRHGHHRHGGRSCHSGRGDCSRAAVSTILAAAAGGDVVRVVHLSGGVEARRKLLDLGIVPGEKLRVVKNDLEGPLLVSIYETTMMIGRGLAEKIRVRSD